ncbi:MAG: hypothetical protein Q4D28_00610 [Prevotellaceae bacterium]|nr:hypothetical protein [Prevotellaceae bacterium]
MLPPTASLVQWGIYLFVNGIFIYKYSMRADIISPYVLIAVWAAFIAAAYIMAARHITAWRRATAALLLSATAMIGVLLWKVEPLSVNVDRWSATTYFLDALFHGDYPYAVQTHIGNYSSPFPLWQYINIPFWLMGDVGLGLIAFLWMLAYGVRQFTQSTRSTFLYLLLLLCSPAYWWEVVVRSDGLSNAILVFCTIMIMCRRDITFTSRPVTTSVISGLVACTRLSAALPLGILLLRPWLWSSLRVKLLSTVIIAAICLFFLAPYMFWDGNAAIFMERNPFQTQTFQVSLPGLLLFAGSMAFVAWRKRPTMWMLGAIPVVMLAFILTTMLWHNMYKPGVSIWTDGDFDVSYLTLSLPYTILLLTYNPINTASQE